MLEPRVAAEHAPVLVRLSVHAIKYIDTEDTFLKTLFVMHYCATLLIHRKSID